MSDFIVKGAVGMAVAPVATFLASGAVEEGDLVVCANGSCAKVADSGAASAGFYAIAQNDAANTESLTVAFAPNGLIAEATARTPSNLVSTVVLDKVTIDVFGGVQKIDENDPNGVITIYQLFPDSTTTGRLLVLIPFSL